MAVTGEVQVWRFEAVRTGATTGRLTVWFRSRPIDGPAIIIPKVLALDLTALPNGYTTVQEMYDDVRDDLADPPYSYDVPVAPAGKLRYGFPEADV